MAQQGLEENKADDNRRLDHTGAVKGLPISGHGAVDHAPAAQGEIHAKQSIGHLGDDHQHNGPKPVTHLADQPGKRMMFHVTSLQKL